MTAKEKIMREALEPAVKYYNSSFIHEEHEKELMETNSCVPEYAIYMDLKKALAKVDAMPDENCGSCNKLVKTAHLGIGYCIGFGLYPRHPKVKSEDFCSRWEAKG